MAERARASVRPAASVVLVRPDRRVYWVRRGEQLRFSAGFYAFPGGGVDLQDASVPLDHAEGLDAIEAPCIAAAARELFEETGVLAVRGAGKIPPPERKAAREGLLTQALSFGELLERHGLRIDVRDF